MTFKYKNIKISMYIVKSGSSKVATWWRCGYCYRQALKDVGKILHHVIPHVPWELAQETN